MLVLGLGDHVSCGSALVRDGKLISAMTDERLVREKMVFGVPRESIRWHLDYHDIQPSDIDFVAIGSRNQHIVDGYVDFRDGWFGLQRSKFKQVLFDIASKAAPYRSRLPFIESVYYASRQPAFISRRRRLKTILRQEFGIFAPVSFVDHHLCHVSSAYYTSGFESATVFSVDGGGDGKCASVYNVVNGQFTKLADIDSFHSLGNFYSYITQICGFKGGKHEGKITGMAAYGEPEYLDLLEKLLVFKDGTFVNQGNIFFNSAVETLRKLLPKDFSHVNLASSVQKHAENLASQLVQHWVRITGQRNVALAGGVMANVRINQTIHELDEVDSIFIHPGMADDGIPVGAALTAFHRLTNDGDAAGRHKAMDNVYLGPEFSREEIEQELEKNDLPFDCPPNLAKYVAELLADSKVVGRFDGKMEYGPRALGNRTLLYRPDDRSIQYWLNNALNRTEFMPFAPAVLEEEAEKCFKNMKGAENTARFMTITFDCTDEMRESCPGVVHIDGTARPQIVSKSDNPGVHEILVEFQKITELPCVINTSFNMHEEPIVCTPADAIRSFLAGGIDYLILGDVVAKNPNPLRRSADATKFNEGIARRGYNAPK